MMKRRAIPTMVALALAFQAHAGVKLKYDIEGFVASCMASGDLSRAVCECTAKKASQELSPTGFDFLVATLRKEKEKSLELRRKLGQDELLNAGMFMSRGPALCARELDQKQKGHKK